MGGPWSCAIVLMPRFQSKPNTPRRAPDFWRKPPGSQRCLRLSARCAPAKEHERTERCDRRARWLRDRDKADGIDREPVIRETGDLNVTPAQPEIRSWRPGNTAYSRGDIG